ncbi:BZ3500_MvSof-1268-A1-R1_Chr4-1g06775 [Microbotryum saponariae]|uniref:BZ3500_MvSof-1268-A1-R1_Chr4-1g06775 protein n=1 Tax=Microbotryum saponariae TaxID=289078 RepID=A0A2X0KSI8_9BASI|nr:BZ3500_MvSof-1268-A1-R1_Chr4-1g06775 [Microbotryum saponariae]SDA06432.1 BZ3501_MvSof-1269-A2-R1_Chr4-1g06477 [Microbotryum saponariae]
MTEQASDHLIPSQHLPTLSPYPPPSQLRTSLDRLQRLVAPHQIIFDLRSTSSGLKPSLNQDLATLDAFELTYTRQWLERLVSLGSRRLVLVEDEEEVLEWEGLVEDGSYVLGRLMGGSASGGSEQVFLLPSPLGQEFEPLRIRIRETTLLSNSTGFRTWGSATLLAQRIASNPFDYLPTTTTTMTTSSDSEPVAAVRILELGSGTGLVGLTLIATLSALGIRSKVDLTDHEDSVLDNLRRNSDRFSTEELDEEEEVVGSRVSKLDWSDHQSALGSIRSHSKEGGRKVYDLIVAADVIYEPDHVGLIHSTVAALLRQPDPRSTTTRFGEGGTFHLALPLRSTHGLEMEAFEKTFPRVSSERDGREESGGGGGEAWRLAVVSEELIRAEKGDDGFESGNGVEEYRLVRIRWDSGEQVKGVGVGSVFLGVADPEYCCITLNV